MQRRLPVCGDRHLTAHNREARSPVAPHVGSDGRHEEANGWSGLTERALGAPLPVAGLAAWIVGAPRANAPHSIEPDASGRAVVLRQDGWEIVYAYSDGDAKLPARLQLSQSDLEVRIVVLDRH